MGSEASSSRELVRSSAIIREDWLSSSPTPPPRDAASRGAGSRVCAALAGLREGEAEEEEGDEGREGGEREGVAQFQHQRALSFAGASQKKSEWREIGPAPSSSRRD